MPKKWAWEIGPSVMPKEWHFQKKLPSSPKIANWVVLDP